MIEWEVVMEILREIKIDNKILKVIKGDLTEENVDAIVNAANSHLQHGGGVAGAIVRKGGRIIQEESNKIGHVPVGKAAITTGGKLKAKYVIHTVGPVWGEGDEEKKLESAVRSALEVAAEHNLKSVSLPAISSGIFGFPKEKAVPIIFNTTVDFLKKETSVIEVHFCNIDGLTSSLFAEEADKRQS